MAIGATKARRHRMVTVRMVVSSVVVGVVLAVASVPVAVLIAQARQTPPFPAAVIDVVLDRGDHGVWIRRHDSFGYEIWNAWNVRSGRTGSFHHTST